MLCQCHGEEAYWQKDSRTKAGGWWECAVKRRARERERYDRDPVHRIEKILRASRDKRVRTLERRRADFVSDYGGL